MKNDCVGSTNKTTWAGQHKIIFEYMFTVGFLNAH